MSCLFPYYVRNPAPMSQGKMYIPVPCGKCPVCLKRRADGWSFRLLQHEKISDSASFVTLTYENPPMTKKGFMTIHKRDFQLFMKRLRKLHPKGHTPLRYYAVGEYGSKSQRPHYHAIIYNLNRDLLHKAWPAGHVHVGDVSGASVAYTVKYMSKGKLIPAHKNDDRNPEFSLMSKRLGTNYISSEIVNYHHADISRNYLILEGGVKIAMPRYYREKIYTEEQRKKQGLNIELNQNMLEQARIDAYKLRTGSVDGYEFSKHEAKRAALSIFKSRALSNRKKL